MKHLLIILITLCSLSAFSQSSTPRTGVGIFHDNTFRAMTLKYVPVTVNTAGTNDTIPLSLNAYKTLVSVPALTDTVTFMFPSVASCYLGDEVTIAAIGLGALEIKGANVVPSNNGPQLTVGTRAIITFIFDGAAWFEEYRDVQ